MKHKWHDEIVAWAGGKKIERNNGLGYWIEDAKPSWNNYEEYRIKPTPKKPQYLYVSKGLDGKPDFSFIDHQESIGKIKLEVDDVHSHVGAD